MSYYNDMGLDWSKKVELDLGAAGMVTLTVVNNPDPDGYPVIYFADLDKGTADWAELGFTDTNGVFSPLFHETARYQHKGCRFVGPKGGNVVARAFDATALFSATVLCNGTIVRRS